MSYDYLNSSKAVDDVPSFMKEVDAVRDALQQYEDVVQRLETLYKRANDDRGLTSQDLTNRQKESVHQEGKALGEHIKQSIKALNSWNVPFNIKASQMEAVKARFRSAIMNFQAQERLQDAQLREVIARQYSIVNPEATQQEINEAIEQKQPVFAQYLKTGGRTQQAQTVLGEVEKRHQELLLISQSLNELAELFDQLNTVIAQQGETIERIEVTALNVQDDIELGVKHVNKGIKHAKSARRKKWWCFLIILILIIILAGILVGVLKATGVIQ